MLLVRATYQPINQIVPPVQPPGMSGISGSRSVVPSPIIHPSFGTGTKSVRFKRSSELEIFGHRASIIILPSTNTWLANNDELLVISSIYPVTGNETAF